MRRQSIIALFICLCSSCSSGTVILPLEFDRVFTKDGSKPLALEDGKNRYLWFVTIDGLRDDLYHTPRGKIDEIMSANPDWQFICYCRARYEDSTAIESTLKRFECSIPVVIDEDSSFLKLNNIKESYSDIGFICDAKGRCLGVSTIGTRQSFFDDAFAAVKRRLRK